MAGLDQFGTKPPAVTDDAQHGVPPRPRSEAALAGVNRSGPQRAPALGVAVFFAAGMIVDRWLTLDLTAWLIAAALALGCWLGFFGLRRNRPAAAALLVSVLCVGGARHHQLWSVRRVDDVSRFASDSPLPARLVGVVADEPHIRLRATDPALTAWPRLDRTQFTLDCRALGSGRQRLPVSGRAWVSVSGHLLHARVGDVVEVRGWLAQSRRPANPGGVDFAEYLGRRGMRCVVSASHPDAVQKLTTADGYRPARMFSRLRDEWRSLFARELQPDASSIAAALLLGDRSSMEPEMRQVFAESGAMHLLAISGLHAGILAMLVWLVCRVLGLSAGKTSLLVMAAVWGFALLVEARAPVLRAAVLISVCAAGQPWHRRASWMNSLAVCVLAVLAWNPADLFDVGAQLSFLAVIAIFSSARWISRNSRDAAALGFDRYDPPPRFVGLVAAPFMRAWLRALLVTAIVWLVTAPLVVATFHLVSAVGLLINVVLLPVVIVTLWLGFGLMAAGLLFDPLVWCFAGPFDFFLRLLLGCVDGASQLAMSHAYIPGATDWWLAGYYALLAVAMFRDALDRSVRPVLSMLLAWVVFGLAAALVPLERGELRCTFLSVGHGCAVLIGLPNGEVLAYDAGSLNDNDYAFRVVQNGLWSLGQSRLRAVVISHADVDHLNAVPQLLRSIPVGSVCVPASFLDFTQPPVVTLCDTARREGVPMQLIQSGDRLQIDPEVTLEVLHPHPGEKLAGDNANSLVLLLEFAGRRILLAGDLADDGMRRLLAKPPVDVDVLLSPHHGSLGANTVELADWARPELVVVSTGRAAAGDRLQPVFGPSAEIISTNEAGAVTVCIDLSGRLRRETVRPFR